MLLSEGQMSDFKGAALMIDAFPTAKALLGDKGYDANWFRLGNRLCLWSIWFKLRSLLNAGRFAATAILPPSDTPAREVLNSLD